MTLGRPRPHPGVRDDDTGRMLGTRQTAARLTGRHPDQVRRRCQPVACDVDSRASLYDLDTVADTFRNTRSRYVA